MSESIAWRINGQVLALLMRHMSTDPQPSLEIARAAGVSHGRASCLLSYAANMGSVRISYLSRKGVSPPLTLYALPVRREAQ